LQRSKIYIVTERVTKKSDNRSNSSIIIIIISEETLPLSL